MALYNQAGQMIAGAYDQIGHLGLAIANNMTNGYANSKKQKQLKKQLMSSVKQFRNITSYANYDSAGNFLGNGAPLRITDPQFNALLRMLVRTANVKPLPISSKLLFRGTPVVTNTGGVGPPGPPGPPSTVSRIVFNTAINPIQLDLNNLAEATFVGSASIGAPKTWSMFNVGSAILIPSLKFTVTTLDIQTFPPTFRMSDARWDAVAHTWTPLDLGTYEFRISYDGTNWFMTCLGGPYT